MMWSGGSLLQSIPTDLLSPEPGGKELEDPCYLCWKDLETTEEQDFNRTELQNRCNLFWKKILTETELDFHIGSIHRLPSQVVHVMMTSKRIDWILVTHVITMEKW